jgi:hypothetical protein
MLQRKVLQIGWRQMAFMQLLLPHPSHYHVNHLPLVPTDQQDFLALMQRNQAGFLALELTGGLTDCCLSLPQHFHEVFL